MPSPRHDVMLLPTFRGLSVVFLALSLVVPPLLPPLPTVLCLSFFVTYGDLRTRVWTHFFFTHACLNLPNIFIITVANYEMNGSLHVFPSTPGRVKTEPVKANKGNKKRKNFSKPINTGTRHMEGALSPCACSQRIFHTLLVTSSFSGLLIGGSHFWISLKSKFKFDCYILRLLEGVLRVVRRRVWRRVWAMSELDWIYWSFKNCIPLESVRDRGERKECTGSITNMFRFQEFTKHEYQYYLCQEIWPSKKTITIWVQKFSRIQIK